MIEPEVVEKMLKDAQRAHKRAYAPYSRFKVGAAVLGGSGRIYRGCNVENASYPVSLCAERAAIAAAVADGETRLEAVLIFTDTENPVPPCGMCRQALAEFGPFQEVFMITAGGAQTRTRLEDLLPLAFGPDDLDTDKSTK